MAKHYALDCPLARTLDIIGERWTILVLRDLFLAGPRRYQDFVDSLTDISPNTLSDRLKTLEAHGIVERHFYSDHPPRAEYRLTSKGKELGPVLKSLRAWGLKHTASA
ncbi:MAG: helix-turn-helix domain-containing protein [Pseudomonadota bacterium]